MPPKKRQLPKAFYGIMIGLAFSIVWWVAPVPERFRTFILCSALLLLVLSCFGWVRSYFQEIGEKKHPEDLVRFATDESQSEESKPSHISIINDSAKSLQEVTVEVLELQHSANPTLYSSISLPLKIWPPSNEPGELHPGRPQLCRLFQTNGNRNNLTAALISAQGVRGVFLPFELERPYRIRFKVAARDTPLSEQDYDLKFTCAMSLNPRLELAKAERTAR